MVFVPDRAGYIVRDGEYSKLAQSTRALPPSEVYLDSS